MESTTLVMKPPRQNRYSKEPDSLRESIIELLVPPPANPAFLLGFVCHLETAFNEDFASIISEAGSWDDGITVTMRSKPCMQSYIPELLADIFEVEKIEEEPPGQDAYSNPYGRFEILSILGINPTRRFRITLRHC